MKRRYPYRMKKGSWQSARLTELDIMLAIYAAVVQAYFRVWDYTTGVEAGPPGQRGPIPGLSLVERAFPLQVWSLSFFLGASSLLFGAFQRRHFFVWVGHYVLFATYLALAIGIAIPALEQPWLDGIRSASVLILPCVIHFLMARRTGPKPARVSVPIETVGGPQ